jgi:hypothetical protein
MTFGMDFQSATPPPPPDELNCRRWEVALDFGGSNSTVAYSMQTDSVRTEKTGLLPGEIMEIKGYKVTTSNSIRCIQNCDVPTVLRYENGGNTIRWGYEALERMKRVPIHDKEEGWLIRLFKGGFYDGNNPEEQDECRKVENMLASLPFSKSVDGLAVDFLTKLFELFCGIICLKQVVGSLHQLIEYHLLRLALPELPLGDDLVPHLF